MLPRVLTWVLGALLALPIPRGAAAAAGVGAPAVEVEVVGTGVPEPAAAVTMAGVAWAQFGAGRPPPREAAQPDSA